MTNKVVAVRWDSGDFEAIKKFANHIGYDNVSTFVRDSVKGMLETGNVSQVAGRNLIEYIPDLDKFTWKVKTDMGKEAVVSEDINSEFLEQLQKEIQLKLKEREQLIHKHKGDSVAVPRDFVE
jgi:DNA polymerase I-like protein with 3'-5' exonuclease and polymerase domains